jgi:hypothetical protein
MKQVVALDLRGWAHTSRSGRVVDVAHDVVGVAGPVENADESGRKNSNHSEQSHRDALQNPYPKPLSPVFLCRISTSEVLEVWSPRLSYTLSPGWRRLENTATKGTGQERDKKEWRTLSLFCLSRQLVKPGKGAPIEAPRVGSQKHTIIMHAHGRYVANSVGAPTKKFRHPQNERGNSATSCGCTPFLWHF